MAEQIRKMQTLEVRYLCDSCEVGFMQYMGCSLSKTANAHICSACYTQQVLEVEYPHIIYKEED